MVPFFVVWKYDCNNFVIKILGVELFSFLFTVYPLSIRNKRERTGSVDHSRLPGQSTLEQVAMLDPGGALHASKNQYGHPEGSKLWKYTPQPSKGRQGRTHRQSCDKVMQKWNKTEFRNEMDGRSINYSHLDFNANKAWKDPSIRLILDWDAFQVPGPAAAPVQTIVPGAPPVPPPPPPSVNSVPPPAVPPPPPRAPTLFGNPIGGAPVNPQRPTPKPPRKGTKNKEREWVEGDEAIPGKADWHDQYAAAYVKGDEGEDLSIANWSRIKGPTVDDVIKSYSNPWRSLPAAVSPQVGTDRIDWVIAQTGMESYGRQGWQKGKLVKQLHKRGLTPYVPGWMDTPDAQRQKPPVISSRYSKGSVEVCNGYNKSINATLSLLNYEIEGAVQRYGGWLLPVLQSRIDDLRKDCHEMDGGIEGNNAARGFRAPRKNTDEFEDHGDEDPAEGGDSHGGHDDDVPGNESDHGNLEGDYGVENYGDDQSEGRGDGNDDEVEDDGSGGELGGENNNDGNDQRLDEEGMNNSDSEQKVIEQGSRPNDTTDGGVQDNVATHPDSSREEDLFEQKPTETHTSSNAEEDSAIDGAAPQDPTNNVNANQNGSPSPIVQDDDIAGLVRIDSPPQPFREGVDGEAEPDDNHDEALEAATEVERRKEAARLHSREEYSLFLDEPGQPRSKSSESDAPIPRSPFSSLVEPPEGPDAILLTNGEHWTRTNITCWPFHAANATEKEYPIGCFRYYDGTTRTTWYKEYLTRKQVEQIWIYGVPWLKASEWEQPTRDDRTYQRLHRALGLPAYDPDAVSPKPTTPPAPAELPNDPRIPNSYIDFGPALRAEVLGTPLNTFAISLKPGETPAQFEKRNGFTYRDPKSGRRPASLEVDDDLYRDPSAEPPAPKPAAKSTTGKRNRLPSPSLSPHPGSTSEQPGPKRVKPTPNQATQAPSPASSPKPKPTTGKRVRSPSPSPTTEQPEPKRVKSTTEQDGEVVRLKVPVLEEGEVSDVSEEE